MHGIVRVIAIPFTHLDPVAIGIHLVQWNETIAVVVNTITEFRCTWENGVVIVVAVSLTKTDAIAIGIYFVGWNVAITVVVQAIAQLWGAWIHRIVVVVAITLADPEAIAIGICLIGRHHPITVVVQAIAKFWRSGKTVLLLSLQSPSQIRNPSLSLSASLAGTMPLQLLSKPSQSSGAPGKIVSSLSLQSPVTNQESRRRRRLPRSAGMDAVAIVVQSHRTVQRAPGKTVEPKHCHRNPLRKS
jgi:hypothetical protein